MKLTSKILALLLVCLMALGLAACGAAPASTPAADDGGTPAPAGSEAAPADDKPDTWIADRTITIQAYIDDVGYAMPENFSESPVGKELAARTGIKLDVRYTPGEKDRMVLAAQLASGTIPDAIVSYLDNSSRPEFPILLKAAKEGMFADIAPYFADSQVYKKYLEPGFLPRDTEKNVMFRDDLDGACYLSHLRVERVDKTTTFEPDADYLGGMYIQKSIADALGVTPMSIHTQEDLYNLLVRIQEGGFTDDNGNPVYPLGPRYWGGSPDALLYMARAYNWGGENGYYNMTEDGEILHQAESEYAMEMVRYVRKLLDEGLMHPEFFTMDSTRAGEVSYSKNSAIIANVHNFTDIMIQEGDQWMPLGLLDDHTGDSAALAFGKTGYCVWAISSQAENPEEIFKFFDYMSTYEGQLLGHYGIEGEHYDMVDGFPVLKQEIRDMIANGDKESLIATGADFGGEGAQLFNVIYTDKDNIADFGEAWPGSGGDSTTYDKPMAIAEQAPMTYRLVEGLPANAYLSHEAMIDIQPQMDLLNYNETLVQAMYAGSEQEAEAILTSFVEQLKSAGLEEFREYLYQIYEEDNQAIRFDLQ